ncbi:MAG: hypothetical protein AB7M12_01170 [Hyphomonadaceae bacterium]
MRIALAAAVAAWAGTAEAQHEMHQGHSSHAAPPDAHAVHMHAPPAHATGRDASGTAWQPDVSSHAGLMAMRGGWMVMSHALLNGVYDWQDGARGGEKAFVAGMVTGSATRAFATGDALQFRVMLSPDPFMGKSGYPLLLASGETANGAAPLIDRQHPHDLFMELSARYTREFGAQNSAYLYVGLPGEPAFGPPAFMHRLSNMDSPEAPISHHWLDSTHITFGVATAGYAHRNWKIEASRFRGREPDENRFDIETGALDSSAVRFSWNPTPHWSAQVSWADAKGPEQLAPDDDQEKWSASVIHTRLLGAEGWWSTTLAWGRRAGDHGGGDALLAESALRFDARWTVFARAERTENSELLAAGGHHGPAYAVGKLSLGAVRDFRIAPRVTLGLGGLYAANFIPSALEAAYGGEPNAAMGFMRVKVD